MVPDANSSDDDTFDPLKFARRGQGAERREFPRHRVQTPARLAIGEIVLVGKLEDIGAGGVSFLAVDVEVEVPPGAMVRLTIDDEDDPIEKVARVLRVEDYFDGEHDVLVVGLVFEDPVDV